jgi:hypothetical protein
LKLKDKATTIYQQFSGSNLDGEPVTPAGLIEDIEDDLAIFGGQMKVLNRKGKSPRQRPSSTPGSPVGSPEATTTASPQINSTVLGFGLRIPDVHPSLIRYLNQDIVKKTMEPVPSLVPRPQRITIPDAPILPPQVPSQRGGSGLTGVYEQQQPWNAGADSTTMQTEPLAENFSPDSPPRDWASSSQRDRRRLGYEYTPYAKPGVGGSGPNQNMSNASPIRMATVLEVPQGTIPPMSSLPMGSFSAMTPLQELENPDLSQTYFPLNAHISSSDPVNFYGQSAGGYMSNPFTGPTNVYDPTLGMGMNVDQMLGRSLAMGINLNAGFNWAEVGTHTMDPTGAVEMGLSSESGMDASWIMDIGNDS